MPHMEVDLGPGDVVFLLDGNPAPPPKKKLHSPPIFGPFHCGQMAGWMKMPLGTEIPVGLGPFHIVLDGDPAVPHKLGHSPPIF